MKVILLSCLLFGLAYSADLTCKCGLKSPINMVGLKTKRIDYPWMVALFRTSDNVAYCGGTIVTTRHVVTAAHCVNVPKTDLYLVTGAYDLNNEMENTRQSLPVDRIIVHNDRTSDIALLLTEIEIAYNQLVGPVCIAQGLAVDNLSNQIVKAMGWGRYDPNRPSMDKIKKFREVDLEVMSPNSCSGVNETRMCTYKAGKSSCNRDSGGPIVWKDPEARRYILVGVVSSGPDNCGDSSAPGVNINVLHYQGWINDMIGETSNAKACFVV